MRGKRSKWALNTRLMHESERQKEVGSCEIYVAEAITAAVAAYHNAKWKRVGIQSMSVEKRPSEDA